MVPGSHVIQFSKGNVRVHVLSDTLLAFLKASLQEFSVQMSFTVRLVLSIRCPLRHHLDVILDLHCYLFSSAASHFSLQPD